LWVLPTGSSLSDPGWYVAPVSLSLSLSLLFWRRFVLSFVFVFAPRAPRSTPVHCALIRITVPSFFSFLPSLSLSLSPSLPFSLPLSVVSIFLSVRPSLSIHGHVYIGYNPLALSTSSDANIILKKKKGKKKRERERRKKKKKSRDFLMDPLLYFSITSRARFFPSAIQPSSRALRPFTCSTCQLAERAAPSAGN